MMKKRAEWLRRACAELGLDIEVGYRLTLPNGPELTAIARIRDLGASNGILIFERYEDIRGLGQQLVDAGYGFSVLDEPMDHEEFDLQGTKDVFIDWGWGGEPSQKPSWMQG